MLSPSTKVANLCCGAMWPLVTGPSKNGHLYLCQQSLLCLVGYAFLCTHTPKLTSGSDYTVLSLPTFSPLAVPQQELDVFVSHASESLSVPSY